MNKEELNKRVGRRIIELRRQYGMSQAELSRACMKDRQSIERLEKGKINPTLYTLFEIALALDIRLKDIVDI